MRRGIAALVAAVATAALGLGCSDGSEPDSPTVLMIHGGGFSEHSPLANRAAVEAAGYRTVAVNYPLGDVAAAYRAVARQIPEDGPVIAYGESVGGTIALWLAAQRRVDRAISVGAPTDLRSWKPTFRVRQPWHLSPARLSAPNAAVYHWTEDYLVALAQARKIRGAELHVLNGVNHQGLPPRTATRAVRRAVALAREAAN